MTSMNVSATLNETALRVSLAGRLKKLRQDANCTQAELAEALLLKTGYVSHIEAAYPRLSLDRVSDIVKRAYDYFGVPFETPSTVPPPAEVDTAVVSGSLALRAAVAKRIEQFQSEFDVPIGELARIFRLSSGHAYVLRTGKPGASEKTLKNVVAILDRETSARRIRRNGTRHTVPAPPAVAAAAVTEPATTAVPPVTPAVTPPPTPARADDAIIPATLVRDSAALLGALDYDFQTKHRIQKLPDGSYLIVKEK